MRTLVVVVAALALGSCSQGAANICEPVPDLATDIGPDPVEKMAARDPAWLRTRATNCVHRWGYRLAGSKDEGETVAKAVMKACNDAVNEHADAFARRTADDLYGDNPTTDAQSHDRFDFIEEGRAFTLAELESEALFRVQQARAGKCKVPK